MYEALPLPIVVNGIIGTLEREACLWIIGTLERDREDRSE